MKRFGFLNGFKQKVDKCIPCQADSSENYQLPLQMFPLPVEPWHTVHMDYYGPFPTAWCASVYHP